MRDAVLEHQHENLKRLMAAWQKFHKYLTDTRQGHEYAQEDEAAFLKLKSQIAILHDTLVEVVGTGNRDETNTVQMVIDVVERCILLRTMKRMSPAEIKRMEIEWHDGYLLMNDKIGVLEDEINRLSHISEFHHNAEIWGRRAATHIHAIVGSRAIQSSVAIVVVLLMGIILPAIGVYDYSFLDKNPNGKKVHTFGRRILRSSVAKNIAFRDWEEFLYNLEQSKTMLPVAQLSSQNEKETAKSNFYGYAGQTKNDLGPIRNDMTPVLAAADDTYIYEGEVSVARGKAPLRVAIAYFKLTETAREKYNTFETAFKENKMSDETRALVPAGRNANLVYFVDAANPDAAQKAVDSVMMNTPKTQ